MDKESMAPNEPGVVQQNSQPKCKHVSLPIKAARGLVCGLIVGVVFVIIPVEIRVFLTEQHRKQFVDIPYLMSQEFTDRFVTRQRTVYFEPKSALFPFGLAGVILFCTKGRRTWLTVLGVVPMVLILGLHTVGCWVEYQKDKRRIDDLAYPVSEFQDSPSEFQSDR